MKEPDRASDYREREVQAVYSVILELGQVLGAYRDKFVIVGGAVPWLLLPDARPQHIGTVDIDLDLNVEELSECGRAFGRRILNGDRAVRKAGLSTWSGGYERVSVAPHC